MNLKIGNDTPLDLDLGKPNQYTCSLLNVLNPCLQRTNAHVWFAPTTWFASGCDNSQSDSPVRITYWVGSAHNEEYKTSIKDLINGWPRLSPAKVVGVFQVGGLYPLARWGWKQGSGDFWAPPAKIRPFTTSTGFFRIWPVANLLPSIWIGQYPTFFFQVPANFLFVVMTTG